MDHRPSATRASWSGHALLLDLDRGMNDVLRARLFPEYAAAVPQIAPAPAASGLAAAPVRPAADRPRPLAAAARALSRLAGAAGRPTTLPAA